VKVTENCVWGWLPLTHELLTVEENETVHTGTVPVVDDAQLPLEQELEPDVAEEEEDPLQVGWTRETGLAELLSIIYPN